KDCTPAPVLHVHSFNMIQAAGPSTRSEIPAVAAHDIMKLNLSPPSKHLSCPTHLACVTPGFDTRTAAVTARSLACWLAGRQADKHSELGTYGSERDSGRS
ncbi:hypothetical protein L915_02577, partial [Phytophthora nicotianae]